MTPQELRYSILHLAFSGNLIISGESEIVAPPVFDDAPFDIPESWKWSALGDCCEMYTGNSISESEKKSKYEGLKEGYDYIGTKDVSFEHVINYDNGVRIPFKTEFRIAFKDSILMCIEGGSAGRKIAILNRDVCFGNKLCMFRTESVLNTYLYYYLQSFEFRKAFMDNMTGIIGGVSIKKLKSLPLPLPPYNEQKKIAEKLECLFQLIDSYEIAWKKLDVLNKQFPSDMQKSIFQLAVQGKLVPQDPIEGTSDDLYKTIQTEKNRLIKEGIIKKEKPIQDKPEDDAPFDIPESWKWLYINDLAFVTKLAGFEYTKYMAGAITPKGEVPIVRAKNVKPRNFIENTEEFISMDLSKELQRCALDTRCILMTFIGAGIGDVAIFENKRRNHLAPNVAKIVPHIDICDYLLYYFMSPAGQNEIFQFMKAVAQPSLSMETIRKVRVPVPPLLEQYRIVAKIEELLPLCEGLKK